MKYLTEEEFQRQMTRIKMDNAEKEKQLLLKAEKEKYINPSKPETSKLIAIYLFLLLNAIVIYAMVVMWHFSDLSYLGVLISDIAAQVLIYAIYCLKAYHAKKQSELMKFDREKLHDSLGVIPDTGHEQNSTADEDSVDVDAVG